MKPLTVILFCTLLTAIWYTWKIWVRNENAKRKLQAILPAIKGAVNDYELLTNYDNYFSNFQEQQFLKANSAIFKAIASYFNKLGLAKSDKAIVAKSLTIYKNIAKDRATYNELFIKTEAEKYAHLFDTLENYPLSSDQVEAIVRDEDNNLVIAGAGTGKTTTISTKVAYLLTAISSFLRLRR